MAGKTDFKALMLARGEKFLLLGAIAVAGLLLVWGVLSAFNKIDPAVGKKELDSKAQAVKAKMNSDEMPPAQPPKPLPQYTPIAADQFLVDKSNPFEPTVWPDRLRQTPVALPPIESQIDLFLASVRKHPRDNFVFDEDGGLLDFQGQFITKQANLQVDTKKLAQDFKDLLNPGRKKKTPRGGVTTGQGGAGAGGPRGGGGGGQMPPPGGSGDGFGEGGPGGMYPGGMGYQPGQLAGTKSSEDVVEWKKYSEMLESGKLAPPAYGVFPVRMAVVQLSYPLEAQLKEIQRALRLRTLQDAIAQSSPQNLLATDPVSGRVVPYTSLYTGTGGGGGIGGGGPPGGGPVMPGNPLGGGGVPRGGLAGGPSGEGTGFSSGGNTPLTANNIAAPVFAGFTVQRRVVQQDGTASDWQEFDHADRWYSEFTLYDAPIKPDTGYLPYFLRLDQGMAAPMPEIAPNWTVSPQLVPGEAQPKDKHYPELVRMPSIMADTEALLKVLKPKTKKEAIAQYTKNPNNPYNVGGGRLSGGIGGLGMGGMGMGDDDGGYGVMGGGMGGAPRGPQQPQPGGGAVGGNPNDPTRSPMAVKHMLIRFLDTDLMPGQSYQYRVSVKLRNPNFGKKKEVADEKQADVEYIPSPYYQCAQTLKVPGEAYIYAGSIKEYEKKVTDLAEQVKKDTPPGKDPGGLAPDRVKKLFEFTEVREGKRAVVLMQRWLQGIAFGGEEERIGAWVQAEMPVAPGEFIGRRTLVELPLWKAAQNKYQLTPPNKKLVVSWPDTVPSPVGRPVDFRTSHMLLDYEGGKASAKVDDRTVSDEAATELLILRADGKLEVRKELTDAKAPDRMTRDKNWKDWIAEVRKQSDLNGPATPGGFDPGRGGPGGTGK
jgi:hypothetical protein